MSSTSKDKELIFLKRHPEFSGLVDILVGCDCSHEDPIDCDNFFEYLFDHLFLRGGCWAAVMQFKSRTKTVNLPSEITALMRDVAAPPGGWPAQ